MTTLKINKAKALKAFGEAANPKELMEKIFGKSIFPAEKKPAHERIKTFEHACKEVGAHPVKSLPYPKPKNNDEKSLNAHAKLRIIASALNEKWTPDWGNSSEYKYYPWFNMPDKTGVGFSYDVYGYRGTATPAGPRLCFKSSELAKYAGTQFLSIYKDFITL